MQLSDRALLVQLNISIWSANRLDKTISAETTKAKGAVAGAARVHKSLLPGAAALDAIKQQANLIRGKFYANTLPWDTKGAQILPTPNYLSFMTDFGHERNKFDQLVNAFLPQYPQLVSDARIALGKAYDPTDYPSQSEIAGRFKMDLIVSPVPSNDFRVTIASEELTRIRDEVAARVKAAERAAMQDLWNRLYERVKHMADKLSDPTAVFRDSTVEHLLELCEMLPRLNVTEDPDLEAMRQEVERKLAGHHPDKLRTDMDLRQDTARDAAAIMRRMAAFMGDAQ